MQGDERNTQFGHSMHSFTHSGLLHLDLLIKTHLKSQLTHKRVAFYIFGSFNKWEKQERPQSREHTSITWMDAKRSNRHKNETQENKLSTNNSSHHSVHPEYISSSYSHLKLKSYWSIRNSNGKSHTNSASRPEDKKSIRFSQSLFLPTLSKSASVWDFL